jgi:hypothetical protein
MIFFCSFDSWNLARKVGVEEEKCLLLAAAGFQQEIFRRGKRNRIGD